MLERMHNGEPLDDIIRRVTGAAFLSTDDMGERFILDNDETAEFTAAWYNYLEALSREKGEPVSGSLLMGLDTLSEEFFDPDKTVETDFYRLIPTQEPVTTVPYEVIAGSAGRSVFDITAYREGAEYAFAEDTFTYQKYSGKPVTVVCERSVNKDDTAKHLKALELNGRILTAGTDYTVTGSTEITLTAALLDSLDEGFYCLTFVPDDTPSVSANLAVEGPRMPASAEKLCEMALVDFAAKNETVSVEATAEVTPEHQLAISLKNDAGDEVAVYTVNPATGAGTDQDGEEINLPQTGVSSPAAAVAAAGAVVLIAAGLWLMLCAFRRQRTLRK